LAESMVNRLIEGEKANGRFSAETLLLGLRVLEQQSKWQEMLSLLEDAPIEEDNEQGTAHQANPGLTKAQLLREKAILLRRLNRYEEAKELYEKLLKDQPDDWSSWKGHMESSIFTDSVEATEALVDKVLKEQEELPYQLRGPHLMRVEFAEGKLRSGSTEEAIRSFGGAIRSYIEIFASRAACTFSDLEKYVNTILRMDDETANEIVLSLLELAQTMRCDSKSDTSRDDDATASDKKRQSKLRTYIFAIKLTHKLLAVRKDLIPRFLPDWKEIIAEWRVSLTILPSSGGEEVSPPIADVATIILSHHH
jgi:tetratricopeptide (TPR) repeat protein